MKTLILVPPPDSRVFIHHRFLAPSYSARYALARLVDVRPSQLTVWHSPAEGLGGSAYNGHNFVFQPPQYAGIELGIIYPAKGVGYIDIALAAAAGADRSESVIAISGFSETRLAWCLAILGELSALFGLPIGPGGFAHDC